MIREIGVRWTLGDVSDRGFEALRLSLWGAWQIFGAQARFVVCVNSLPLEVARARTGTVPPAVRWRDCRHELPALIARHLAPNMAEGVGWKFAPLRCFPQRWELALDNDCILWAMPAALRAWLTDDDDAACLLADDITPGFGRFAPWCGPHPLNSGIRGLPPDFDLESALRAMLALQDEPLSSELDEQGLQAAALTRSAKTFRVSLEDVTICSPFYPHQTQLGRCGAHFVGLNARHLPWNYFERPATECRIEHWEAHRREVARRVGLD